MGRQESLLSIRVETRDPVIRRAVRSAERDLGDAGRVLLRPSGTEPLIRIMVEGRSAERVKHWAETLADTVRKAAA